MFPQKFRRSATLTGATVLAASFSLAGCGKSDREATKAGNLKASSVFQEHPGNQTILEEKALLSRLLN